MCLQGLMDAQVANLDSHNSFFSRLNEVGMPLDMEPRASRYCQWPRAHALQAPGVTPMVTDSEAKSTGNVDPDETTTRTKSELETMTAGDEGMAKADDLQKRARQRPCVIRRPRP